MADPTLTTFTSSTTATAAEVEANDLALAAELNGSLDAANQSTGRAEYIVWGKSDSGGTVNFVRAWRQPHDALLERIEAEVHGYTGIPGSDFFVVYVQNAAAGSGMGLAAFSNLGTVNAEGEASPEVSADLAGAVTAGQLVRIRIARIGTPGGTVHVTTTWSEALQV